MKELLAIYIFGFLIELIKSIHTIYRFQWLKQKSGIDMFAKDHRMQSYLIRKPIFWPWFFVTEKSPIERLSESLFKNYGDEGHTYFGSTGLKNFLNDVFRGKNRYKNYKIKKLIWPLDKTGKEYQDLINSFPHEKKAEKLFASIIYAQFKQTYLLYVAWSSEDCLSKSNVVSRFELDCCERISHHDLRTRLLGINSEKAQEFLASYFLVNENGCNER